MDLSEFGELDVGSAVGYHSQTYTVERISRRSRKVFLRPAMGSGPVVGPIDYKEIVKRIEADPQTSAPQIRPDPRI